MKKFTVPESNVLIGQSMLNSMTLPPHLFESLIKLSATGKVYKTTGFKKSQFVGFFTVGMPNNSVPAGITCKRLKGITPLCVYAVRLEDLDEDLDDDDDEPDDEDDDDEPGPELPKRPWVKIFRKVTNTFWFPSGIFLLAGILLGLIMCVKS